MARAQFDRNDVLDRAIELFWKNGFSASSMQQVVKATGLKPGSIYLAFENKEGLFKEALERYASKGMAKIRSILENSPSVGEGICQLLENNIKEAAEEEYSSCFLVKTQLELAAECNNLYELASLKLSEIEALYESYLKKEYGEENSKQRATSLMLHIFGIRVYGYRQGSTEQMREGLQVGLPWLPWKNLSSYYVK